MRIALFDADFIPYYTCYNKKDQPIKTLEECHTLADQFIQNILQATKATHYIMAFTVGKCFRYKVYPEYKANRIYKDVIPFLKETKEYLIDKYQGVYHEDLEADDIVNIYKTINPVSWNIDINDREHIRIIVSPDKDILNLEGTHFNPKKMEWITTTQEEANIYFWTSMIAGDSSDGIKSIPKKGVKFAEKLFNNSDNFDRPRSSLVLEAYVEYFGEKLGIEEFYKNYKCLKILDKYEGFKIPEPVAVATLV